MSREDSMRSTLLRAVEQSRDAMVAWTRQLVAIPTENPPGNHYQEAVQIICKQLEELGFEDTRVVDDCVLSFVGEGERERILYFSGHYDVVPAQDSSQFAPQLKGVNLFGRGSSDMKSGLAAMTYAAKAVRDSRLPLQGRIGLVFVPDEETAGTRGSRHLASKGLLGQNGIGMLTPEPTGGVVWNANRGAITLQVTIKGKSAHVGRQFEGVNAFEQMLRVCGALTTLKNEVEARTTSYRIAPESARRSILMMGGQAEAGKNFNVVPETCTFTVDRRLNPEEDFHEEKRRLLETLEAMRTGGIDLEVKILQEGASAGVPEDSGLGSILARNIRGVTGRDARFEMCPGLLEIRFYAERGISAFAYGPGLLTVSHGPNEFVPVDRITECAAIYALTAAELLSGAPLP
jgi:acetylornithine deacetylase/succinyl-diaminopimelate desuccinylase family protein